MSKLTQRFAEKLKNEITDENFWKVLSDYELRESLEIIAKIYEVEPKQRLMCQLEKDKSNALNIIKLFTPTIVAANDPKQYKGVFSLENYNKLKRFIDPQMIYDATIEMFGHKKIILERDTKTDRLTDEDLIAVFQEIHTSFSSNFLKEL
jgi:hypothetical protein